MNLKIIERYFRFFRQTQESLKCMQNDLMKCGEGVYNIFITTVENTMTAVQRLLWRSNLEDQEDMEDRREILPHFISLRYFLFILESNKISSIFFQGKKFKSFRSI